MSFTDGKAFVVTEAQTKLDDDPTADRLIDEAVIALGKLSDHLKKMNDKRVYDTNKAIHIMWGL